jgi:hypothetical protein
MCFVVTAELRHGLRELIPWKFLRVTLAALLALGAAIVIVALSLAPKERLINLAAAPRQVAGAAALGLVLSVSTGIAACVAVIRGTTTVRIALLAPLSPAAVVLVPLIWPIAITSLPFAALALPAFVMSARTSPLTTVLLLVGTGVIACAANTIVISVAAAVIRRKGPDDAVRVLKSTAGFAAFGALALFPIVGRTAFEPDTLVVGLVVAACMLPFLFFQAAASLVEALPRVNLARHSPTPVWGRPGWLRILNRAAGFSAVGGLIPALLVINRPDFEFRRGGFALLAVALPQAILTHIMGELEPVQSSWGVGPAEGAVRRRLVLQTALLAGSAGLALPLLFRLASPLWLGTVALLIAAAALSVTLRGRWRPIALNSIYVLAFLTNFLP